LHDRLCELHEQGRFVMPLAFSSPHYTAIHLERSVQSPDTTFSEQAALIRSVFESEFGINVVECVAESDESDPWE
jgi:hypothetical protein